MLPLVPIFLAQLVGQSVSQSAGGQDDRPARFITFLHAVMFVLGFTLAFVALGATASALGSLLRAYQFQLRQIGGVLLVLIGLYLTGILKLPFLSWQKRFAFHPSRPSYVASLLIGIIFAIGWTPCISLLLGFDPRPGRHGWNTSTGGLAAAVLLAWHGSAVSAARPRS